MSFVRKNLLTLSGKFFVPGFCFGDGDNDEDDQGPAPPEPSSATCVITYYAPVKLPAWLQARWPKPAQLQTIIPLVLQADGSTWKCQWDSSAAEGRVDWAVYSSGAVVAAAQGNFVVKANSANVSVP